MVLAQKRASGSGPRNSHWPSARLGSGAAASALKLGLPAARMNAKRSSPADWPKRRPRRPGWAGCGSKSLPAASLTWEAPPSLHDVDRSLLAQLGGSPAVSALDVAAGRLLAGASPIWPVDPLSVGLLQIWPGERRLAGLRLQLAAASGCARSDLSRLAVVFLRKKIDEREARDLARDWANSLGEQPRSQSTGAVIIFWRGPPLFRTCGG